MSTNKPTSTKRKRAVAVCAALIFSFWIQHLEAASAGETELPDDILIVANKNISTTSVSPAFLRDLFLKIRKEWRGGERAVPVNPKDEQLRTDFQKKVLHMDDAAEQRHWENVKIKYGDSAPPAIANNLKAVFTLNGAVSYVYRKDYRPGVANVVLVIPANEN